MTLNDVLDQSGDAHLAMIHPTESGVDGAWLRRIQVVAPKVSDSVVAELLGRGASWRERLIGLALAMRKAPKMFLAHRVDSLEEPRGIAIVPTCAAIAVASSDGLDADLPGKLRDLPRHPFDGEIGWSLDKLEDHLGFSSRNPQGRGPNYGQDFEAHLDLFRRLTDATRFQ